MLCALVGNSSERSVHPGWSGAHSCRDAEMHSRRSDGADSATIARAATPPWRHSPRSSTWYAMVSATSPPHAAAPNSEVTAFIWSPVPRNLRQARTISQNTPDKTLLWIMSPAPCQGDGFITASLDLLFDHTCIGTVPINLENAGEAAQVTGNATPTSAVFKSVGDHRRF